MRERLIDWLVEQGLAPDDDISDQGIKDLVEAEARRSFRDLSGALAFVESPEGQSGLTLGWTDPS